ncbi:hypothetical protein QJS04_geneDACA014599 [Acorus gramineus]|uniref:NADH:quinone oxidoreductase/Mrp antiporter transmembrane domain-containing protein n=1 Tax=Acorus gramineus TaxID=55184 RepID=A0AAV9AR46_ACOGR|nr:hypothetical protein QJS04_geneDACA014599 [Acorus gramineus]
MRYIIFKNSKYVQIRIALIFITVGIGFKLSLAPFHQWTPDVYEGVRFVRQIPTSISISEMFGFFKTPWTCRREMLSPLGPRHNFYQKFIEIRLYITLFSKKKKTMSNRIKKTLNTNNYQK